MTELFRKVKCSERLPEKDGYYITNGGLKYYNPKFGEANAINKLDWWLEPVEIPTDKEVWDSMSDWNAMQVPEPPHDAGMHFIAGANFVLNHLTKGK